MHDVVIVGGGPVGLFLAALLVRRGLDVRVLERRTDPGTHSRAIGIHPPALAALDTAGIAGALVGAGTQIREGAARCRGAELGRMSFARVSDRFPFVLALPQTRTETVLEDHLEQLAAGTLRRGILVEDVSDAGDHVLLSARGPTAAGPTAPEAIRARFVVGADGAHSTVRARLGFGSTLRQYPDCYLMGDFADNTGDGALAVLYIEPAGIVESFPLPGATRRWVVRTPSLLSGAGAAQLCALITERTGVVVELETNSMLSAFAVRCRLATRMVAGRAVLIGDAAHEVSPIGGQGMNLGWLDALALAPLLERAVRDNAFTGEAPAAFERSRRRATVAAARRAHVNMALGRPAPGLLQDSRELLIRTVVSSTALKEKVARVFTMQ